VGGDPLLGGVAFAACIATALDAMDRKHDKDVIAQALCTILLGSRSGAKLVPSAVRTFLPARGTATAKVLHLLLGMSPSTSQPAFGSFALSSSHGIRILGILLRGLLASASGHFVVETQSADGGYLASANSNLENAQGVERLVEVEKALSFARTAFEGMDAASNSALGSNWSNILSGLLSDCSVHGPHSGSASLMDDQLGVAIDVPVVDALHAAGAIWLAWGSVVAYACQ